MEAVKPSKYHQKRLGSRGKQYRKDIDEILIWQSSKNLPIRQIQCLFLYGTCVCSREYSSVMEHY